MKLLRGRSILPDWKNAAAAVVAAILLILAFPDFEFWFLAWIALVPLLWAVEREKGSAVKSFVLGWLFGTVFFFGACWWLTFAPITYAGFPPPIAYFLLFCVTVIVGVFPGLFAGILSVLLKRYGKIGILAAPFVWVFTEFLRYWLTGNNWNAIGYSQAFQGIFNLLWATFGGVLIVSFGLIFLNSIILLSVFALRKRSISPTWAIIFVLLASCVIFFYFASPRRGSVITVPVDGPDFARIVAIQPNVPMTGLTYEKWKLLRQRHVELAESALKKLPAASRSSTIVIFPESPMNFAYEEDEEFQQFVHAFAAKHNVSVLFNSAEPDPKNKKYFNSAVLVGPEGKEIAQYDKIYLVPFGESVPAPLQSIVPAFVGSFSYGEEYDVLPLGDAKGGVMICFESHFGSLSREYVHNGADVLIEMTNDGYLGPTPVLRQHLANAVFRAVETNRPVLRVTNVGITAYINEKGQVLDATDAYQEDTRIWSVAKSDGSQTFYVKYGDWFAWLCSALTLGLLLLRWTRKRAASGISEN